MAVVTVLGAGAMGSGICTPLVNSGWDVRLWGTWLDDHLLDAIEADEPHPRTGVKVSRKVVPYRSQQLDEALDGADVVVMAVSSVGVPRVTELALSGISKADALWLTSKGLYENPSGKIVLLPDAIRQIASENNADLPPIVAIAGPVKANECAADLPTATVFGCSDFAVAKKYAGAARTENYAIAPSGDETGVEVCAPMKNVYAIALGIADGLEEAKGFPHHNLKAAAFAQSVKEMSALGAQMGADPSTAYGLPGVGDLEVTGLSGRNKVYGVRIGRGETPAEAIEEMTRLEQTVEGIPAAALAVQLVEQQTTADNNLKAQMPLLYAIAAILDGSVADPGRAIQEAALPTLS